MFSVYERSNLRDTLYFDHDYAVTDYKSQCQTTDKVFCHMPAYRDLKCENRNTYNSFYTSLKRGDLDIKIYTIYVRTLEHKVKSIHVKKFPF